MTMLLDMVEQYDAEKKAYFLGIREKVLLHISTEYDHKKILSFLNRVGVIAIDEKEKIVYIGVPNEFVITQIKKFFLKSLKDAVKAVYNPQFSTKLIVYTNFQSNGKGLLPDLKKLLNIKESKAVAIEKAHKGMKNELTDYFGILFDSQHRFDTYVAGASTNFAFSAAKAVAQDPGKVYNPLFLYGNVGLGKTHLMQAIGNEVMKTHPEKVIVYLPASKLIDEIVDAIRSNKLTSLMKKFDSVDVLLIDDIQFLADKDKTQEIFHNIFNDFHMKKKQVILTSDRPPKELVNIAARLKSRFSLGLVADIQSPDYETRIAILQSKLASKGEDLDFEFLSLVAKYIKNNVRELEGALNILLTRKKFSVSELTQEDVISCLKTLGYAPERSDDATSVAVESNTRGLQNYANLVEMVSQYYNIGVSELKSASRKKEISTARQQLMLLAKKYFGWTLEKIGDYFGGKNHASVIYAINNIEKKIKYDTNLAHDFQVFVDWLEK